MSLRIIAFGLAASLVVLSVAAVWYMESIPAPTRKAPLNRAAKSATAKEPLPELVPQEA